MQEPFYCKLPQLAGRQAIIILYTIIIRASIHFMASPKLITEKGLRVGAIIFIFFYNCVHLN